MSKYHKKTIDEIIKGNTTPLKKVDWKKKRTPEVTKESIYI